MIENAALTLRTLYKTWYIILGSAARPIKIICPLADMLQLLTEKVSFKLLQNESCD